MAKTFLERHKKKSLVGLLIFLLRGGKGFGPLLLLVAFLSFLFIVPANFAMRFPLISKISRALGVVSLFGGPNTLGLIDLEQALRAARAERSYGWGSWLGGNAKFWTDYGKSSVDMVRSGRLPHDGGWGSEDGIAARSLRESGGKSISGIMDPEAAKLTQEGVPLDQNELMNGLMNNANAGMFGGGEMNPGFQGTEYGVRSGRGINGGNMLNGGAPVSADNQLLQSSYGGGGVPGAGGGRAVGRGGKLSGYRWAQLRTGISGSMKNPRFAGSSTDMYGLAVTNAYSLAAALPAVSNGFGSGKCPEGNCPREYAANTAGVPFWTGHTVDGILAALDMGDPVSVPSGAQLQTLVNQAAATEQQAKACENAQAIYGPQEQQWMNTLQADGNQLSQQCSGGGCGGNCQTLISKMRADCRQYNAVVMLHYQACPLMQQNGTASTMNCNQ